METLLIVLSLIAMTLVLLQKRKIDIQSETITHYEKMIELLEKKSKANNETISLSFKTIENYKEAYNSLAEKIKQTIKDEKTMH